MNYADTIKSIIFKPREFFSKIGREKGIKKAFVIFLGYLLISNIVDLFTNPENTIYSILAAEGIKIPFFILLFIISVLIGLLITFIVVGMDYLFLRLLKGKGSFENTFNAQIFSSLPFYIVQILLAVPMALWGKYLSERAILVPSNVSPNLAIIFGTIIFFILIFGVIIYSFYWYVYSLSILNKISKLRAFVAVVVLPLLIVVVLILILAFVGVSFMRSMFGV